jgi:hypothetical protein
MHNESCSAKHGMKENLKSTFNYILLKTARYILIQRKEKYTIFSIFERRNLLPNVFMANAAAHADAEKVWQIYLCIAFFISCILNYFPAL